MQEIVIPDLDDDDDLLALPNVTRTAFGQGAGFSDSGSTRHSLESPASTDNLSLRSGFGGSLPRPSLPRSGLSYTTFTSQHELAVDTGVPRLGKLSNGSASSLGVQSPNVAGSGLLGSRKGSFASLKNILKAGVPPHQHSVPPVPSFDSRNYGAPGYPTLKNPFNRFETETSPTAGPSTFARPRANTKTSIASAAPSAAPSMYHGGKQSVSTMHTAQRSYGGRSQTSQGSSNFKAEDYPLPALPSIPNRSTPSRSGRHGSDTSMFSSFGRKTSISIEDPSEVLGKTPADEALRVVYHAFREAADHKIKKLLAKPLNSQISLNSTLETGADQVFDEILHSLAHCARQHARRVVEVLNGWCQIQCSGMGSAEARAHLSQSMGLQLRPEEAALVLSNRRSSAARYIYHRALIEIVRVVPSDSLAEDVAQNMEHTAFSLFRSERTDDYNQKRAVSNLLIEFFSELSKTRLLTVSERFTRELSGLSSGAIKDPESKIEHILKGVRQLKLRVYPEPELEMAAEFIQTLSAFFANAHGSALKCAYAETFTHLLHPVIETATAEVNHPMWAKAIAPVLQRAIGMAAKPRYWNVAFPLVVVTLAVSPREIFMEHWQSCIDVIAAKNKDRAMRVVGMNAFIRLLWVYLNRCPESSTSTRKRLEGILRHHFPSGTGLLGPADIPLEPFVAMLHYVMSRHMDYGQELVVEFLRDAVPNRNPDGSPGLVLHPERAYVAIKASSATLRCLANEKLPSLPLTADFSKFEFAPLDATFDKELDTIADAAEFIQHCGPMSVNVLLSCDRTVGNVLLSCDAVTLSVHASSTSWEGTGDQVTRKHGDVHVTYPAKYEPTFRLLAALLDPLPALLSGASNITQLINILCRASFSADPATCEAAAQTMRSVAKDPLLCPVLVDNYRQFVFDTHNVFRDNFVGTRLLESQLVRVVKLWVDMLEELASQHRTDEAPEPVDADFVCNVESCGLFLLCSSSSNLRRLAHPVFSSAQDLGGHVREPSAPFRYSRVVLGPQQMDSVMNMYEKDLDETDMANLNKLSTLTTVDFSRLETLRGPKLIRKIAESDSNKDAALWAAILPAFVGKVGEQLPDPVLGLRSLVGQTVVRLQAHVSMVASSKSPRQTQNRATSDPTILAEQWRLYLSTLSVTMDPAHPVQLSRKDQALTSELMMTPALFAYLTQILAWDDRRFQEAAVFALGSIRQASLRPLAENLLTFVRRLADGYKASSTPSSSRRPSAHSVMWTSAAHVFSLIAPLISSVPPANHQAVLSSFIGFVKLTLTLLSDRRDDYDLQSLRRWFCIVVDHLATALGKLDSSDRFLGDEVRGAIFKLCYDWCHVGRRPDVAKARESQTLQAAADSYRGDRDRAQFLDDLQAKTKLLSAAAAEAMASLCLGKLISTSDATPAQQASEHIVEPLTVLRWIRGMFQSSQSSHHDTGRKALHALIKYNWSVDRLSDEVLHQSFGEGEHFPLEASFFGVVADIVSDGTIDLPPAQLACLSLSKLGHPVADVRQRAFQLAVWLFDDSADYMALASYLPAVGSAAPNVYRYAQLEMATRLAELYPQLAIPFLAECTTRLTQLDAPRRQATLSILPAFMKLLELEADTSNLGEEEVAQEHQALSNLMYLVVRFSDDHLEDVRAVLVNFAGSGRSRNTTALVKFLFEQGAKRSSPDFIQHAQQIISCLAASPAGDSIFEEICTFVHPSDMSSSAQADLPPSPVASLANLDALFTSTLRAKPLSQGQMALLFAGQLLPHRLKHPSLVSNLPALLHGAFVHCDDPNGAMREQAQSVLFQVLRAWISILSRSKLLDSVARATAWSTAESRIAALALQRSSLFWKAEDTGGQTMFKHAPSQMSTLVAKIQSILQQVQPKLRQQWGALALEWATSCTMRHLACRSFQVFRILSPDVTPRIMSDMLARLASTISSPSTEIQSFNSELIRTFTSIVENMSSSEIRNYPQMFWCTIACLTTPYEAEFNEVVELLSHLLDKTNLSDPAVVSHLISFRPPDWAGPPPLLQPLLLIGLRSSKTDMMTFDVLRRLTSVPGCELIDEEKDRFLHGFVAALPWMLHSTDLGEPNEELTGMASDLADIANRQGSSGMSRLLTSFARNRFRTKEDFIKQTAMLLRDYMSSHPLDLTTLLLCFVLNRNDWMREKSLAMLKLVLMHNEARALAPYTHELVRPLLRVVSTKHAAAALEVLDMRVFSEETTSDPTQLFGTVEASGWSVPNVTERAEVTRNNVLAVFNTCAVESRAASAHFSVLQFSDLRPNLTATPKEHDWAASQISLEMPSPPTTVSVDNASIGDLVGALHSLNQFFDDGLESNGRTSPVRRPHHAHFARGSSTESIPLQSAFAFGGDRVRAVMARGMTRSASGASAPAGLQEGDEEYADASRGGPANSNASAPMRTGALAGYVPNGLAGTYASAGAGARTGNLYVHAAHQPSFSSESEFSAGAGADVFGLDDELAQPRRPWHEPEGSGSRTPSPRDRDT